MVRDGNDDHRSHQAVIDAEGEAFHEAAAMSIVDQRPAHGSIFDPIQGAPEAETQGRALECSSCVLAPRDFAAPS